MQRISKLLFRVGNKIGVLHQKLLNKFLNRSRTVVHNSIEMQFCVPNSLNSYRAKTFSSKEPETLEWIESFNKKSIFWDIGANIGLYSIYAAKYNNVQVYAFEPSVFNLEFLAKIFIKIIFQKKLEFFL